MTEKRDAAKQGNVGKQGDPPAGDGVLPRPEDILPSVLNELKRHARVLRRAAERALEPKKLGDQDRENR